MHGASTITTFKPATFTQPYQKLFVQFETLQKKTLSIMSVVHIPPH